MVLLHFLNDPSATHTKNHFKKMSATLADRVIFVCPFSLFLPLKQSVLTSKRHFKLNPQYLSAKSWDIKMLNNTFLFDAFATPNKKPFPKTLLPWLPEPFLHARYIPFLIKNCYFLTTSAIIFSHIMESQAQKLKIISKRFCFLAVRAARAIFDSQFFTILIKISCVFIKSSNFL
jgi:hypothetical protein